jgi:hypothetical protein
MSDEQDDQREAAPAEPRRFVRHQGETYETTDTEPQVESR